MDDPENQKIAEYERDAHELKATALRNKYESTYSSWKNRKHQAKAKGWHWAEEWQEFSSFLISMGPRPSRGHTLDRIDTSRQAYGPGLCRWLDARGQANNRSSTSFVEIGGEKMPLSEGADRLGVKPGVLRRHLDRSVEATATEVDVSKFGRDPRSYKPWPWDCPQLGKPHVLEIEFLLAGGTKVQSRYTFLLERLKDIIRPFEQWLMDHAGEAGSEEFDKKNEIIGPLSKLYREKIGERDKWLKAKTLFRMRLEEADRRRNDF